MKFKFIKQLDSSDCAPACLKMISNYHKRDIPIYLLREHCHTSGDGTSIDALVEGANRIGLKSIAIEIPAKMLLEEVPLPCVVFLERGHFIVIYKISQSRVYVADPAFGKLDYSRHEFINLWNSSRLEKEDGIVILFEPTPKFFQEYEPVTKNTFSKWDFIMGYLIPHKKLFLQLIAGLVLSSLFQLIFPLLTQSIVDIGIKDHDLNFITLILIAQFLVFFSSGAIEVLKSWLLLHIGTRINISIASDFISRVMALPISFFESRKVGDILQRVGDNQRIENFISEQLLNSVFTMLNITVVLTILFFYHVLLGAVALMGAAFYLVWVVLFLKRRRKLDYVQFDQTAETSNNIIELISNMREIKLNVSEEKRRRKWEALQLALYGTSIKTLSLSQFQNRGGSLILQAQNIVVIFMTASFVVEGQMTLGMMLAIQYLLGQLQGPLNSLLGFITNFQDAKISFSRINEVTQISPEYNPPNLGFVDDAQLEETISIKDLKFQYKNGNPVFEKLSFEIPANRFTALVGPSGSGKTTLLKLLLKFDEPNSGTINVGSVNLNSINSSNWRRKCGVVMQDGQIFSDTLLNNIIESEREVAYDRKLFDQSIRLAMLNDVISNLPNGIHTKLGPGGMDLSGGEKQRVLIARALYKNPQYLFFDEATSALDSETERQIVEGLNEYFVGKTVFVIAHRLSTVKKADHVILLGDGEIIEEGTHDELVKLEGKYFRLVQNQLNLSKTPVYEN